MFLGRVSYVLFSITWRYHVINSLFTTGCTFNNLLITGSYWFPFALMNLDGSGLAASYQIILVILN